MNVIQKRQVQEAANFAASLVKNGVVSTYALAIHRAAKAFVYDPDNYSFLRRAVALELRARYKLKAARQAS